MSFREANKFSLTKPFSRICKGKVLLTKLLGKSATILLLLIFPELLKSHPGC